jgi:hypothetical protein
MPTHLEFVRLRAALAASSILVLAACGADDTVAPTVDSGVEVVAVGEPAVASATFAGGIPFGLAAQPVSMFGSRFNGGKRTIGPGQLLKELAEIRSRGGRVVLMMAGNPRHYKDGSGHFSLERWKDRVNQFRNINFQSYIDDGTVIGHYLMDEPNDPKNWRGKPVPASAVEDMAKHSKDLWPNLPTIVRTHPDYLDNNHRYLDAAWAQYLSRRGNVRDYIRENVAEAQKRGLELVVGLNIVHGGTPQGTNMTASEVEDWGSALLESSYPCAFIMWQYQSSALNNSGMGSAMESLRRKAENRPTKRCG